MKAFALSAADKPAELITLPKPEVGPRDVLVAIRAASVNGFDVSQASGGLTGMMEHRFPTVIGRDLAGVVEGIGSDVTDVAVGDEVFGFVPSTPPLEHGTFAEYISATWCWCESRAASTSTRPRPCHSPAAQRSTSWKPSTSRMAKPC